MKNIVKHGRIYGLLFGGFGLLIAYLEMKFLLGFQIRFSPSHLLSPIVVLITFATFAFLFGGRANKRIQLNAKNALLEGALSSIFTLMCTVAVSAFLILLINNDLRGIYPLELLEGLFVFELFTLVIGGIPAILIGIWFGYFLKTEFGKQTL